MFYNCHQIQYERGCGGQLHPLRAIVAQAEGAKQLQVRNYRLAGKVSLIALDQLVA
jgi:hypothetical protein